MAHVEPRELVTRHERVMASNAQPNERDGERRHEEYARTDQLTARFTKRSPPSVDTGAPSPVGAEEKENDGQSRRQDVGRLHGRRHEADESQVPPASSSFFSFY